ncbi:MAG: T9SS type A sorting domain-containing protein [Saprospiraceae bacterium]|nr:T9SS type A sorting domain-containing protein [Saprospiraceae bacterium]
MQGDIHTNGNFEQYENYWLWSGENGSVRLGNLTVVDATHCIIPSRFQVNANTTAISIAASDLAQADFPVTLDPEIGNDFAISNVSASNQVQYASVAYNSQKQEYLAVWAGTYNASGVNPAEPEIWGQRINAVNGSLIGNNFRISDMGPDNQTSYGASAPEVAYNRVNNTYLVVWYGDDNTAPLVVNEAEIFGQLLDADGNAIGTNDFRISSMGDDSESNPLLRREYDAKFPALTYNATNNEFLVVWYGDDVVNEDIEIWGQRINANTGAEIGNDFQISMIDLNNATHVNDDPSVIWNSDNNEYLVTWHAGNFDTKVYEIIGQRVSATGTLTGSNFMISNSDGKAREAAAAYNPNDNEYLVIWASNEGSSEYRINGQRINATGTAIDSDFLISTNGEDVIRYLDTHVAAIAYDAMKNEFSIVWSGEASSNDYQVYNNFVAGGTSTVIGSELKISSVGGNADSPPSPAVALNHNAQQYLAVWTGNGEIVGQRFDSESSSVPVELISFRAFSEKQGIRLEWETASEIENEGFEIQRLQPGALDWEKLGFLSGVGNSVEKQYYQFWDKTPRNGLNYYRLKQIDFDGAFEYSNIIAIENNSSKTWNLYPNPSTDVLYFEAPEVAPSYQIKIWNAQGQLLQNYQTTSSTIVLQQLMPGWYWVQISSANQQVEQAFLKK